MKWTKKKKCDECKKEQGCSDCKKYQDKAFELEVDEELQNERLAEFWKKYSWLVYSGIVIILLLTVGFEWYRTHQIKMRLEESDLFEKATLLAHNGKNEEAVGAFSNLSKSAKTGYRILALMNLADIQMKQGQSEDALKSMKAILESTQESDPLYLVTSLSYVGYQMDSVNADELLRVLKPALNNDAFQGLATELAVPLMMKQGKKDEAQKLIQRAIQNPMTSTGSKARLNTLKGE